MSLKKVLAIGLFMGIAGQALAETTLRVGSWLPPTHPQNTVVWPTWSKWVEEATDGRVKVVVEYGLGHPKTMFELVEDGVVDAAFSFHGYVPGRFKLTQAVEQPMLGASAEAASVAHWRIHQKYFAQANEHDGLELIGLFTHGPGQVHMAKPVEKFSDLKGKKIRLGGGVQAELGHRMGVTAVGAPAPKVYEMMQQGVIDGVFIPMVDQKSLRLKEVAKNVIALPGGMYLGSFAIFMNPDFLADLDQKDRDAILSVSGEKLSAMAGKAWDDGDKAGIEAAKDAGVNITFVKEGDALAHEFSALTQGMDAAFIKSVESRGVDTKAALTELRQIAVTYNK
ncbi:TRAP transporter substrate-binding protein [Neptuniibacter caesariensis]|uniref:TRAP-type C4-dicarboxylate transport system, periplasmic component n=1 Tax=Neptuniibacter caesariensis TaxID=207954 RepID=A0A7U8GS71_NEPCE|nr:TRAP transporter substrate-binding protein [Neptuniibacter caesariensis]EAR62202.1 TRAP-type C4-dicarboxylate transport system, periplasmic component [Oceanospirillum sp. MED92] [Neptuniibacter caesariensis]